MLAAVKAAAERVAVWLLLLAFCGLCWLAVIRWVWKLCC
jgi:hypothetical protein